MRSGKTSFTLGLFPALFGIAFAAMAGDEIPLKNWPVPMDSPAGLGKAVDASPPRPFIGLPPCRIVDTRGNGAPIQGGMITGGADVRTYDVDGICGIPTGVDALSLNFTVVGAAGAGFLTAWPAGGAVPPVSILNFVAGETVANAAILPVNASAAFTVNASAATHLLVDVNGYFSDVQGTPSNFFLLDGNVPSPDAVVVAENDNASGSASAVLGRISSTAPGAFSAGIRGINNSTTGSGIGVYGSHAGGGWGVYGTAVSGIGVVGVSTSGPGAYGASTSGPGLSGFSADSTAVFGQSNGSGFGNVAIDGLHTATSGRYYGVRGRSANTSVVNASAGVLGLGADPLPGAASISFFPAGVRGEAEIFGVLGVSLGRGVGGIMVDSGGSTVVSGFLGFDDPGSTTNYGVFSSGDFGGTGAKYFVEPHPEKADMVIRYVALEGPEAGTYFRGKGRFQNGVAVIDVPEDFRLVTDAEGLSVQITPYGGMASVGVVRLGLDRIVVQSSRNLEFFYLVQGIRKSHRDLRPIGAGGEFRPESAEAKIPAHLTEGQKRMLISNGTYNADGTVNMETATALGWKEAWERTGTKKKEPAPAK